MHTHAQSLIDSLALSGGGVPIYVQLRDQILRALGEGRLKPGDQMPTMRQVAITLKIDLSGATVSATDPPPKPKPTGKREPGIEEMLECARVLDAIERSAASGGWETAR